MKKCSCGNKIFNSSNEMSFFSQKEQDIFNILLELKEDLCRDCKYKLAYDCVRM